MWAPPKVLCVCVHVLDGLSFQFAWLLFIIFPTKNYVWKNQILIKAVA